MSLTKINHGKHYEYSGTVVLPAGKKFKIETSPSGEELVNETVPAGKVWKISIGIKVLQEDI